MATNKTESSIYEIVQKLQSIIPRLEETAQTNTDALLTLTALAHMAPAFQSQSLSSLAEKTLSAHVITLGKIVDLEVNAVFGLMSMFNLNKGYEHTLDGCNYAIKLTDDSVIFNISVPKNSDKTFQDLAHIVLRTAYATCQLVSRQVNNRENTSDDFTVAEKDAQHNFATLVRGIYDIFPDGWAEVNNLEHQSTFMAGSTTDFADLEKLASIIIWFPTLEICFPTWEQRLGISFGTSMESTTITRLKPSFQRLKLEVEALSLVCKLCVVLEREYIDQYKSVNNLADVFNALSTIATLSVFPMTRVVCYEHCGYLLNRDAIARKDNVQSTTTFRAAAEIQKLALQTRPNPRYAKYVAQNLLEVADLFDDPRLKRIAEEIFVDYYCTQHFERLINNSGIFGQWLNGQDLTFDTLNYNLLEYWYSVSKYSDDPYSYVKASKRFLESVGQCLSLDLFAGALLVTQVLRQINGVSSNATYEGRRKGRKVRRKFNDVSGPDSSQIPIMCSNKDDSAPLSERFPLLVHDPALWLCAMTLWCLQLRKDGVDNDPAGKAGWLSLSEKEISQLGSLLRSFDEVASGKVVASSESTWHLPRFASIVLGTVAKAQEKEQIGDGGKSLRNLVEQLK